MTAAPLLAAARTAGLAVAFSAATGRLTVSGPRSAEAIGRELLAASDQITRCGWCSAPAPVPGDGTAPICGLCPGAFGAGTCLTCGARDIARNTAGNCRDCARLQPRRSFG